MKKRTRVLWNAVGLAALCLLGGCQCPCGKFRLGTPTVLVRPAPAIDFPGANKPTDKPGETDCNSPFHWEGATLYVFNSAGHPWRSSGSDLLHLTNSHIRCEYDNQANGGRWIECTWKNEDGVLYGWYHNEPVGLCPGTRLTAPRIGAARSNDNGATWDDLGIILEAPPGTIRCDTANYYFAGGNGDFSAMRDAKGQYLYLFISTYSGSAAEQGVALARMRWADRDNPAGKVSKWHAGSWKEPGLAGKVTPILPATVDWHTPNADAFWGPSIHWNSYLKQYVLLLNRTQDANWTQEGIYVSFNDSLEKPDRWSKPSKILANLKKDEWYPQVVGLNTQAKETDKLAGSKARLFLRGHSAWEIEFTAADP